MQSVLLVLVLAFAGFFGCAAYVDLPVGPPSDRVPGAHLSFFYDALSPYGDWLWVEPWGWAWTPWDVSPGWRPYTDGHWVWTQLGWTWLSDRPWGWAPFHYGRWTYQLHYGWIWIPDTVWAPAWVAWRSSPGWIGWAPLPPRARWRMGIGLDLGGVDIGLSIVEHGWSFCGQRDFLSHDIGRRLAPLPRNAYLLRETRDRTRYEEVERRVAVRPFDVDEVERWAGPVDRYQIEDVERPPRQEEMVERRAVRVYRPEVKEGEPGGAPERRPSATPPATPPKEAEGAAPAKPAPPSVDARRQAQELKEWQEKERQGLDDEHERERQQPPKGETPAQVDRRQRDERKTLKDQERREKDLQNDRRERRDRQAKEAQKTKEKESAAGKEPTRKPPPPEK